MPEKEQVPIKEGLWRVSPGGEVRLIGSKCLSCGEVFFPRKESGICVHLQERDLQDIELSTAGKIMTFTVIYQQPGGTYYKGPVPYAYGIVDLTEGVRVETLLTGCDVEEFEVGMDVSLTLEKLGEDEEGRDVITFKFQPAG